MADAKENENSNISTNENDFLVSKSSKAELLVIGGEEGRPGTSSLQDNFKKFRDQKIRERQLMSQCRRDREGGSKRSQEFKDALREKFIEQAKKYLGVPYAERYKAEDAPVAPLYLDCCGLVRQCVQDLQEEFGFVIGRWNQAYQMDTLPIVYTDVTEMKSGDLIFYEGIYTNKAGRSKPQKHNNVHVEIFLPGETGEGTIGSRFQRGNVSIFPSYKFKSTSWDLVKYHFRSLDTWLEGICISHCPEHPWNAESLALAAAAGKRSIFCDGHNEEQDVGAECFYADDQEEQQREGEGECEGTEAYNCPLPELKESREPTPTEQTTIDSTKAGKRPSRTRSTGDTVTSKSMESLGLKAKGRPKRSEKTKAKEKEEKDARIYYVGQSNGWKMVKDSLDRRGWQQLPFEYQFSSRFGLKWVERRSQIDFRAHVPGQLVCHIPNNDILTTKVGLLSCFREKFCKRSFNPTTPTKIKQGVLASTSSKTPSRSTEEFLTVEEETPKHQHSPWLPETYDLEVPEDCLALIRAEEEWGALPSVLAAGVEGNPPSPLPMVASASSKPSVWIYKPSSNNRGRGIKVVQGMDSLKEICYGKKTDDPETTVPPSKGILQQYVTDPLLINGYKFDIRCYLLIAKNHPQTVAYYHPGYCRMALKAYDLSDISDLGQHLTNAAVQKLDKVNYETMKDIQIQSVSTVADTIEKAGAPESGRYMREDLDRDIKLCMVDILRASNNKLLRKHGYFDLLGCDFMLGVDNKLYLLEVNTNPAMSKDNHVLEDLLPRVVDGAIELVISHQRPELEAAKECPDIYASDYQLLFDEATGYEFSG